MGTQVAKQLLYKDIISLQTECENLLELVRDWDRYDLEDEYTINRYRKCVSAALEALQ